MGPDRIQGQTSQCRFLYEPPVVRDRRIHRWQEHRKSRGGVDQVCHDKHNKLWLMRITKVRGRCVANEISYRCNNVLWVSAYKNVEMKDVHMEES